MTWICFSWICCRNELRKIKSGPFYFKYVMLQSGNMVYLMYSKFIRLLTCTGKSLQSKNTYSIQFCYKCKFRNMVGCLMVGCITEQSKYHFPFSIHKLLLWIFCTAKPGTEFPNSKCPNSMTSTFWDPLLLEKKYKSKQTNFKNERKLTQIEGIEFSSKYTEAKVTPYHFNRKQKQGDPLCAI